MFSEDTLISMVDGTFKEIIDIKPNDYIFNKFKNPVRVLRLNTYTAPAVGVQFNNETPLVYTGVNTQFICVHKVEGTTQSHWANLEHVDLVSGKVKSSMKTFSPLSDVTVSTFLDNVAEEKVMYCIQTKGDMSKSYIANGVIVKCNGV